MAEGGTNSVTCRYFLNGVCKLASGCHFSHDRQSSRPDTTCSYYLKGACTYGSQCKFDHVRPQNLSHLNKNSKPVSSTSQSIMKPSKILNKASTTANSSNFTRLTSKSSTNPESLSLSTKTLRADAPEFVPSCSTSRSEVSSDVSFSQMLGGGESRADASESDDPDSELCPFFLFSGECQNVVCPYIHGLPCDMCQLACLHPHNEKQRTKHNEECTKLIEAEMEHSFAVTRSLEKVCGVCMETVIDPDQKNKKRFGILPNCNHCFCLDCLREWRKSKQFENKIIRACPECRVQSDFVVPSIYWVDDKEKEEKDKLLNNYKSALSQKPCKYFNQGGGECPFGNKCFYLHALPDGTKKDVGPPRRRKRINADGEIQVFLDNMLLWNFIEERENRLELLRGSIRSLLLELELDDLAEDLLFNGDALSDISDF